MTRQVDSHPLQHLLTERDWQQLRTDVELCRITWPIGVRKMQTHRDSDANAVAWFEKLKAAADKQKAAGDGTITAGKPGEKTLAEWEHGGVSVRQLPDDEHGILRISIGGGATPLPLNYLVFRGDGRLCRDLLRKALVALEVGL